VAKGKERETTTSHLTGREKGKKTIGKGNSYNGCSYSFGEKEPRGEKENKRG